jgi:hypothetical protein
MKKLKLTLIFMAFWATGYTQNLQEITDIILYEHHGIGSPSDRGDSSGWNFVSHDYINSVEPLGSHPDRDMVEHHGFSIPFGFTSGISSIWNGTFAGNGTTKYFLNNEFDYDNATEESVINAYNENEANLEVSSVSNGEIYIARIRNLNYYVVLKVTGINVETANDFQFNYKYTDQTLGINKSNTLSIISIYPNPANEEIHIKLDGLYRNITLFMKDIMGNEVLNRKFRDKKSIDLNSGIARLSEGIYFITIMADNKKAVFKILKNN